MNKVKELIKTILKLVKKPITRTVKTQTNGIAGIKDGTQPKRVTMGWDGQPMIVNDDGTIYCNKRVELIFYEKYYPNWPEEKWPIDPETGKKLQIEDSF